MVKVFSWNKHISSSVKLEDKEGDPEWNHFVHLIQRDLRAFQTYFKSTEFSFNNDEFLLLNMDKVTREATCVFSFRYYQRCSNSKWEHWDPVISNSKVEHANYSLLCRRHADHFWLDPYFLDNRCLSLTGMELKDKDKNGPFAYTSEFLEDGIQWHEDVWSKRLCHSIHGNIADEKELHIEFTGKRDTDIIKGEWQGVYRFHGAPDITINKAHLDSSSAVMVGAAAHTTTSYDDAQSTSCGRLDTEISGMIENSIKVESYVLVRGVSVVRKTGELLANMHIAVVKRFLNLLQKKMTLTSSLTMYGLLLARHQGTVICSMTMPVVDVAQLQPESNACPTLSIRIESCLGGLTPHSVCTSITQLIMKFDNENNTA